MFPEANNHPLHRALSNAPVQARWANARRTGPAPPNPPAVACNRLLGFVAELAPTRPIPFT